MMNNIAIKVSHLTKVYKLYDKPVDRLKESLHPLKKKYHKDFYALNDVSFEIKKGETVGIIGKNGAGKSTLLKIITGVLTPSSGHVHVNGRIASLLELGAGFNPEYTGVENIYLQGTLMGYSHNEMEAKIDEILAFADIGDFVYQPVKSYSSGMFARLAFAVAINVEPDILIVDEALSVGDVIFQQKCIRKMQNLSKDKTVIFVSHSIDLLKNFCLKSIWIDSGKMKKFDLTTNVVKQYLASEVYGLELSNVFDNSVCNKNFEQKVWQNLDKCESFGNGRAKILSIFIINDTKNQAVTVVESGDTISIHSKIEVYEKIDYPIFGITIKNDLYNVFSVNNEMYEIYLETLNTGIYEFCITFKFPEIRNGEYLLNIGLANGTTLEHIQEHFVYDATKLVVINESKEYRQSPMLVLKKKNLNFYINKKG